MKLTKKSSAIDSPGCYPIDTIFSLVYHFVVSEYSAFSSTETAGKGIAAASRLSLFWFLEISFVPWAGGTGAWLVDEYFICLSSFDNFRDENFSARSHSSGLTNDSLSGNRDTLWEPYRSPPSSPSSMLK